MIIIMEPGATEEQPQRVVNKMKENGFKINMNYGDIMTVIAAIGD